MLSENAGKWAAGQRSGLPAGAAVNPAVYLSWVACASLGNCSAVGSYNDTAADTQGLLLTERAGKWHRGVRAALPAGAAKAPQAYLDSVSCTAPGSWTIRGSSVSAGIAGGLAPRRDHVSGHRPTILTAARVRSRWSPPGLEASKR
jgi:hypothetical protein